MVIYENCKEKQRPNFHITKQKYTDILCNLFVCLFCLILAEFQQYFPVWPILFILGKV